MEAESVVAVSVVVAVAVVVVALAVGMEAVLLEQLSRQTKQ